MAPILSSKDHPLARKIRLVAAGARRAPADLVLAEGVRVLEEATRAGCSFDAVLVAEDFGAAAREAELLAAWRAGHVPVHRAAGRLLRTLSEVTSPQGGVALVRLPPVSIEAVGRINLTLAVCACGVSDPGNLGSVLRSAVAAGAELVCTTRGTVSARNPKTVRSSAGAFFRVPVLEGLEPTELLDLCRRRRLHPVCSDARGAATIWQADLRGPTAVLLGGEARGFSGVEWDGVPRLRIPMSPRAESLNVAAAGAILLFEAYRQRSGGAAV